MDVFAKKPSWGFPLLLLSPLIAIIAGPAINPVGVYWT
jgi:hypothetical protein